MIELLSPYFLPVVGAAVGGIAIRHYFPTLWNAAKTDVAAVEAKSQAVAPAVAADVADGAVSAINWLTDKSSEQSAIAKAQASMASKDALLAHVKSKLPQ